MDYDELRPQQRSFSMVAAYLNGSTVNATGNVESSSHPMLGSGDPTPYDLPLVALLAVCVAVLLAGSILGAGWPSALANVLRRGALVIAVSSTTVVLLVWPTRSGVVGAGRLLTIWPALATAVVLFVVWTVRAGRL
jgi:hypothetical protein